MLGDLVQKLRERTAMLFSPTDPARQAHLWQDHAAILRAVIEGDERAAAALATEHVMRAGADHLFGLNSGDGRAGFASSGIRRANRCAGARPGQIGRARAPQAKAVKHFGLRT